MEIYRIENLTFSYPGRKRPILDGINLTINQGDFITLVGPSGCGKTTLLRHLKPATVPHGSCSGAVYFEGLPFSELSSRDAASKIGFVLQSPENQIVTDKVWHELAFGLESLGMKTPEIRLKVAEMASFFGIQEWFHKPVTELSGGQKQILALASVMALQPSALILDEPTSQLDPIAASEFIAVVGKINRELGVTIILTEHRLEEVFPLATHAIIMDKGKILAEGTPQEVGLALKGQKHGMFVAMPTPMRVWAACDNTSTESDCPITIRDGANWLAKQQIITPVETKTYHPDLSLVNKNNSLQKSAIEITEAWFKYEKNSSDVIKGLSFDAKFGEVTAILGGNGTGKTTTLSLISGLNKPYRGKVTAHGRICALPQNPQSLFIAKTVREDLLEILSGSQIPKSEKHQRFSNMVKLCHLDGLLDSHPYDLSGGEQQRAALAKVLLLKPEILLLDEPTKGLDAEFKQVFAAILRKLSDAGTAIVIVSHDIEFCAEHADRCALFFDGSIVTENKPHEFFSGNSFYTTSANRMARVHLPEAITACDIILALGGQLPAPIDDIVFEGVDLLGDEGDLTPPLHGQLTRHCLSKRRKMISGVFSLFLMFTAVFTAINFEGFRQFISGGSGAVNVAADGARRYVGIMLAFALGLIGLSVTLSQKQDDNDFRPIKKAKLSKRTIVAMLMILLTIPITIYIGSNYLGDRRYYFISLLVILQTMLPFALVFESRKPQARELVIIAVLCAIAVTGRAAFFMLPQFKPVVAVVIISGVAFGGEAGFLVGAMTGFVSNMFFGQGPWTPWQMFAFGIIGFLAGILFHRGLLRRSPLSLAVFGSISTFVIYGVIMDTYTVISFQSHITRPMLLAAFLQGIPFNLIHAAATATFLTLISRPMLEKLDRVKIKYGLVEGSAK